jgi:hypothetical protein
MYIRAMLLKAREKKEKLESILYTFVGHARPAY